MNKSVGTWAIIGLVIVAAYLWLTGKIGSASGTLAGFTGSPGTGTTNPTLTGGLLALESALGLTGTALGNSLALQAGAAANTQVTPVVASSTGDYLPATPAPDINIPTPVRRLRPYLCGIPRPELISPDQTPRAELRRRLRLLLRAWTRSLPSARLPAPQTPERAWGVFPLSSGLRPRSIIPGRS